MEKIIGFTAGAFDMFHVGHLKLINNARTYCDQLIVGVNSDELIRQYKKKQTVIPFVERFEIINAIKGVSKAVRVDTLDKEEIWKNMPYHLLMIGSDWKGNER